MAAGFAGTPRVIIRDMVEKEQSSERLRHTCLCTPSGRFFNLLRFGLNHLDLELPTSFE